MILLLLSLPVLFLLNIAVGSVSIPLEDVFNIIMGRDSSGDQAQIYYTIIMRTRLPQAITAIACGAGLSAAGLLMQIVFRNPLAGPSVLGISSAASLGVGCVVLLSGIAGMSIVNPFETLGNVTLTIAAICGAMVVMILMMFLSNRIGGRATLLIVGVMIGYIATAILGVMKYFSSEENVHAFVIWGLGSFGRVTGGQVYLFASIMAILLPCTTLLSKSLNIFQLGDLYAQNLGLNVTHARTLIIAAAGTLTAVTTAYCGPIMFLGLAVPHICRGIMRTADNRILLPGSIVCGASLALACNLIARMPGFDGALPINSVTALVGAPITLRIILKKKRQP